jgi:tetratricopeptide (TPR) repeat protein
MCLARNAEWSNEIILFESEIRRGSRDGNALRLLTGARLRQGNISRVAEICDSHVKEQKENSRYSGHCAMAYNQLGRNDEAERAFLLALTKNPANTQAHANLAVFYLRLDRHDEAKKQYELALEAEIDPAMRAYRKGELLVIFHRNDRERLIEAKAYFEEALRLQPHLALARKRLERVNQALGLP